MYREFRDSREGFDATIEAAMEAQEQGYYDAKYEAWLEDLEANYEDDDECECDDSYDGQPDEYTEWQDYMGGDDWDHGQYDNGDEW